MVDFKTKGMTFFDIPKNLVAIGKLIAELDLNDILVVEDFKVFPHKKTGLAWDSMYTPKVIGVIEYEWMLKTSTSPIFQKPADKYTAIKLINSDVWPLEDCIKKLTKKNFLSEHSWDAYCHLIFLTYQQWRKEHIKNGNTVGL